MPAMAIFACGTGVTSAATGGGGGSSLLPIALGGMAAYGIAATILGLGIAALAFIVVQSRRHLPRPNPVPVGAILSPDGYYWWDGAGWRPVR